MKTIIECIAGQIYVYRQTEDTYQKIGPTQPTLDGDFMDRDCNTSNWPNMWTVVVDGDPIAVKQNNSDKPRVRSRRPKKKASLSSRSAR